MDNLKIQNDSKDYINIEIYDLERKTLKIEIGNVKGENQFLIRENDLYHILFNALNQYS